jgi:large subunit ribosomal protein L2
MLLSKYKKKIYSLINRKKKSAGRNNRGRITVAHQGGGHKRLYRQIDFHKTFDSGIVVNLEYDPNRSAHIAKIYTSNSTAKFKYILAPKNLKILDKINTNTKTIDAEITENIEKQKGNFYFLSEYRVGDFIYNIELLPNCGGKLVRSAGTFAKIIQKTETHVIIALPSGEHRMIPNNCRACFGNVSNENHNNIIIKKAGRSR